MLDHSGRRGRGRPRSETAESHSTILDAVYELLQERTVRDLTMEAVARKAGVGKPTLYKWWPTKAALVMAMLQQRFISDRAPATGGTAEAAIRTTVRGFIRVFNGPYGKVMAELIAEGQSDPGVLRELYARHIGARRAETVADVERGKATGEFVVATDPELLIDAIFGALYYRLLLRSAPLTEQFGDQLIEQVLRGVRRDA